MGSAGRKAFAWRSKEPTFLMFFNISVRLLESFVSLCVKNICFFLRAASSFVFFFVSLPLLLFLPSFFGRELFSWFFFIPFMFFVLFFVFSLSRISPDVGPELKAPFHHLREREKKKRQPHRAASSFIPYIICMVSSYHV